MAESNLPTKILVVDDDPTVAQTIEVPLAKYNIKVVKATNLDTALYHYNQQRFDVVLVELEFEPLHGLALIQKWRGHDDRERRFTSFVVISGTKRSHSDEALLKELGELEFLTKPFSLVQLLPFLNRGVTRKTKGIRFDEMREKVAKLQSREGGTDKAISAIKGNLGQLGAEGLLMMVQVYEKGSRLEDAMELVEGLLAKNPSDIGLLNRKGSLLLRMGRHVEAMSCLEKADKLAPNNINRMQDMADGYLDLNNPEKSVETMKGIVDLHPEEPDIKFDMFDKLNDRGYSDHALKFCKETTPPKEVIRYYNNKGVALSKTGQTMKAIDEYKKALRYYPKFKENYRILFNIALAYAGIKDQESYERSVFYLQQCLELAPEFEKAKKMLEQVERLMVKAS